MKCVLSVIIPVYNGEHYVEKCIRSIVNGLNVDFEVIIIDDGSTDKTAEIIQRLEAEYPTIRCFHQENAGLSAARNSGLDRAQGKYIWFVDSDDYISPFFELESLLQTNADVICFGYRIIIGEKTMEKYCLPVEGIQKYSPERLLKDIFEYKSNSLILNKIIKRKVILDHALRMNTACYYSEDILFFTELAAVAGSCIYYPKPIYNWWRNNETSLTHKFDLEKDKTRFLALEKVYRAVCKNRYLLPSFMDYYYYQCSSNLCNYGMENRKFIRKIKRRFHIWDARFIKGRKRKLKFIKWRLIT